MIGIRFVRPNKRKAVEAWAKKPRWTSPLLSEAGAPAWSSSGLGKRSPIGRARMKKSHGKHQKWPAKKLDRFRPDFIGYR